jgi:flagellar L-ring protein precursor FlgH
MKLVWLLAVPLLHQSALAQMASPGSVFSPGGRLADSTRDVRAAEVGDIVTILVNDSASALAKGATNSSRKISATSKITGLVGAANPRLANLLNVAGDQELAGTGQTSRGMTLSTTISARVVQVAPNGTLVVEGIKSIAVNSEKQHIILNGLVRPSDLTPANTVRSDQVANLEIKVDGKGVVGDAIRRPHFLYRLLLGLLPF